jgi:hypothetical protein
MKNVVFSNDHELALQILERAIKRLGSIWIVVLRGKYSITRFMSTKGLLALFGRRRGNRSIHARQYDFSNQILITWIGHLDTCDELSQVLAHRQHRLCLPVERTENDFVLVYRAVTLDRWYCGHGYFQNCPEGQKLAFFFLALIAAAGSLA